MKGNRDDGSNKRRGLGKGLSELLSVATQAATIEPEQQQRHEQAMAVLPASELQSLKVEDIQGGPFQPRNSIRHEGIEQLAESIRTQGVIQPIIVRARSAGGYEIVAGERRWRACQLAGLTHIPALIKDVQDDVALAMALIENIQREDLNPIEEARALKRLADEMNLTHLDVAEAVGKSRAAVTNLMRLLALNPEVQQLVESGQLEMGHARALLSIKGSMQLQIAQSIVARGMSVRETERIVARFQEEVVENEEAVANFTKDPNISRLERNLAERLGAPVAIRHTRKGKGTVVIRYNDVDELEGILAHLGPLEREL